MVDSHSGNTPLSVLAFPRWPSLLYFLSQTLHVNCIFGAQQKSKRAFASDKYLVLFSLFRNSIDGTNITSAVSGLRPNSRGNLTCRPGRRGNSQYAHPSWYLAGTQIYNDIQEIRKI